MVVMGNSRNTNTRVCYVKKAIFSKAGKLISKKINQIKSKNIQVDRLLFLNQKHRCRNVLHFGGALIRLLDILMQIHQP